MEKMTKDINKAERQIYILSLLSENPKGFQAEEIQERLKQWDIDVAKRTITRDIDELSVSYAILEEERDGKTYYYADKYTLRNVDFTIEDLASLAFAKAMLLNYRQFGMGMHAVEFIDKIIENSTNLNQHQFDALCAQYKQVNGNHNAVDEVDRDIEQQMNHAIDNRNKVIMDYYSFSSDEYTKRIIHPYRMVLLDNYLNVEAFCELRGEVRRFRLSRMKNVKVSDEHFEYQEMEDKDTDAFLKLTGGEKEELELAFYGESIRYVKEYEKNRAREIKEKDGVLYFYQKTAIAPDVIRWIRGFGADVKVLKPKWLCEQLHEEAKKRLEY